MIKPIFQRNYQKYEPEFRHWVQVRDTLLLRGDTQGADKAQKQVAYYLDQMHAQGYFRDAYNSNSLLTKFNLSW